jgi:hypothetical protein
MIDDSTILSVSMSWMAEQQIRSKEIAFVRAQFLVQAVVKSFFIDAG